MGNIVGHLGHFDLKLLINQSGGSQAVFQSPGDIEIDLVIETCPLDLSIETQAWKK